MLCYCNLDNLDHIQCIPGNVHNKLKRKNSFHHCISNLIIWKSFTILLFYYLISLKTPEGEILFKLF